ncbi:UNVERIFIED_CONTAM: DEAD-box ATP-dependent RNA helicase FANCM [Sesamum indicum]
MASSSTSLHVIDDDDEFDWEAAAQEIDVACQATAAEKPTSISNIRSNLKCNLEYPPQEMRKKGKIDVNFNSLSSTRQSTLDRFIGVSSSNSDKFMGKVEFSEPVDGNISNSNIIDDKGDGTGADFEDVEMLNGFIKIDTDAAKTWIYPVNVPRRDYQFSITRTALFSNTLVVLPTGLGKTLIAAAVMYNFFRWFPEGKIVFAAPSRPLVMQQIEACHKIVGIPQEWTIDLTGQTNPTRRADFWKNKRVFFVTPQVLEKDIQSGTWNGDRGGDFTGPAFVSSPNLQSEVFINSSKQDGKALQDDSLKKMEVPCSSDNEMQTPELQWKNNAPKTCTSPIPVAEEMQTPFARLSEASTSKDWLLDSGVKPETVHQQCKFRRLRKHGDFNRKIPPEPKEQAEPSRKHRTSRRTDYHTATKLFKGEEKRAKDVTIYIEEEAEVSSEAMASNDEEDDQDNSSYEDSFIDDDANPTSAGTQAGPSKTDMMAIYRRSLLSQSPFQGLPNFATNFSPDSVFQSSRINESGSSSGMKHDPTPQTGLESTARNSQLACLEIPSEMADSKLESRKRKLSFYQAQSVPTVNLDKEFSLISEAPGKNSAMQIQAEKAEENRDIFEDDQFYEGIDLDAVEEEAAKLLRYKTDCSTQQTANVSEPIQHNLGVLGSPSFDLRF